MRSGTSAKPWVTGGSSYKLCYHPSLLYPSIGQLLLPSFGRDFHYHGPSPCLVFSDPSSLCHHAGDCGSSAWKSEAAAAAEEEEEEGACSALQ
mmetsp:Transcript_37413/g.105603  ORF Transcript_37413/g.105603 Transcript_37413/m.105603 type:complete len:93 (+) Transcript_37413:45-323(+)